MKPSILWKGVQFGTIGISSLALNAFDKNLGKRYLINELSRLPGLGHKASQLLTMRFSGINESDSVPKPAPLSWVRAKIEEQSPALASQILEIDPNPRLASLGQVHRARLTSQKEVAIKVRYPQVDKHLEEQIEILLLAFQNIPKFIKKAIDIDAYKQFLKSFFLEELNYLHEAKTQNTFREAWSEEKRIIIPEVLDDLSTGSILVQSFEDSCQLTDLSELTEEKRLLCATLFSHFFIQGIFHKGLVHTDLHPKNWGFRPDSEELVIYDFGATLRLDPLIPSILRQLASDGILSNGAEPIGYPNSYPDSYKNAYVDHYTALGFNHNSLTDLRDILPELTRLFFSPFQGQDSFDFQSWNFQKKAEDLLGNKKWIFRSAGPPWFLMTIRSFNGWLHAIKTLRSKPNLSVIMGKLDKTETPKSRARQPMQGILGTPPSPSTSSNTRLRVQIQDAGKEIVSLEFPAFTIQSLEDLMPDTVLEDLKREGIDIKNIELKALSTGLKAQPLFERTKGVRAYRVWLE